MQLTWIAVLVIVWATTQVAHARIIYNVSLDTWALVGHPAGTFALNFQFNDGEGTGDANNTVVLSDFEFGGGNALGSPVTFGGASGALSATVTITDSAFLNSFTQEFMAGSLLTFRLNLSTNVDPGPTPDQFSIAILDNTGFEIPTGGLAVVGSDVFLLIDINAANPVIHTFGSDVSRLPSAGGGSISIPAPAVTAIPEPNTVVLLSGAFAVFVVCRMRPSNT